MKFRAKDYIRNRQMQQKLGLQILTPEELKEIHLHLLDIYQEIVRICKKHSLTILLSGGSTLGAVRHRGFIPWDDDLDLMMLRPDYERFVEAFNEEARQEYRLKEQGLFLNIIKDGCKYVGLLGAEADDIIGHVDIFPIDFVPESHISRIWRGCISNFLFFIINSRSFYLYNNEYLKAMFSQNFIGRVIFSLRRMLGFLVSGINSKTFLLLYKKIVIYPHPTSKTTIACGTRHYFGEMLEYSVFFPVKTIKFEKYECLVPHQVGRYLSNLYGSDYMQLPPVEKREPHPCVKLEFRNPII